MTICVLIDGDSVLYRCGFSVEHTIYTVLHEDYICPFKTKKECNEYTDKLTVPYTIEHTLEVEPVENAISNVCSVMGAIADEFSHTTKKRIITYLSGDRNFRYDIAKFKPYKGNRVGMARPKYKAQLTELMQVRFGAILVEGIEADDALAMQASSGQHVIVAMDKDLDQVPGHHYNWHKQEHYYVSPEEAEYNLYVQILSGDPTDNIEGVKGIGAKRALKLYEGKTTAFEYWDVCVREYQKAYGSEGQERLMETANLVYLLRSAKDVFKPPSRAALETIIEKANEGDGNPEIIRASSSESESKV